MRGITEKIMNATRIFGNVIKLLYRSFAEVPLPKMVHTQSRAIVKDKCLGRTAVGIQITGFRITNRPAIRLEIMQVHHVSPDDTPNRVAPVIGTTDIMALLT